MNRAALISRLITLGVLAFATVSQGAENIEVNVIEEEGYIYAEISAQPSNMADDTLEVWVSYDGIYGNTTEQLNDESIELPLSDEIYNQRLFVGYSETFAGRASLTVTANSLNNEGNPVSDNDSWP